MNLICKLNNSKTINLNFPFIELQLHQSNKIKLKILNYSKKNEINFKIYLTDKQRKSIENNWERLLKELSKKLNMSIDDLLCDERFISMNLDIDSHVVQRLEEREEKIEEIDLKSIEDLNEIQDFILDILRPPIKIGEKCTIKEDNIRYEFLNSKNKSLVIQIDDSKLPIAIIITYIDRNN